MQIIVPRSPGPAIAAPAWGVNDW